MRVQNKTGFSLNPEAGLFCIKIGILLTFESESEFPIATISYNFYFADEIVIVVVITQRDFFLGGKHSK